MNDTAQLLQLAKTDRKAARRQVEIARCELSFAFFVQKAWHVLEPTTPLVWGKVMDVLCARLQDLGEGKILEMLINVPPGFSKSLLTCVFLPAWRWGPCKEPGDRILGVAHDLDLSTRDAAKMRRLVKSDWFQERWPDVQVADDQDAKKRFDNTASGFRVAKASKNVTGERGDFLLYDDPHSVAGARSDVTREEVCQNFRGAIPTRINDVKTSRKCVIMQRVHERDVSGVIFELGGWYHLCLPMRFDPENACADDWRTEPGELLFPERFDEAEVQRLEATLGPYEVAAQLQQRPAPRGDALIDMSNIEFVDRAPPCVRWVRAWDFAAGVTKAGSKPDWTVGVLMGMTRHGDYVISNVRRFQKNTTGVDQELEMTRQMDGRNVKIRLPQDPGAAGKSRANHQIRQYAGSNIVAKSVGGDKVVRAGPLAGQIGAGNVKLVRGEWNMDFIDELSVFPMGTHDDQVDAAADAFDELVNGKWPKPAPAQVRIKTV